MTEDINKRLRETLLDLAAPEIEPLCSLALGLIPAVGGRDVSGPGYKETRERISAMVEHLARERQSPSTLIEALLAIDGEIAARSVCAIPWAMNLAPMAVERYAHAVKERREQEQQIRSAELSPIFQLDHRTLVAVPVGHLGTEGLPIFVDRVLSQVLHAKPKRVLLALDGLEPETDRPSLHAELETELKALKVHIEQPWK